MITKQFKVVLDIYRYLSGLKYIIIKILLTGLEFSKFTKFN